MCKHTAFIEKKLLLEVEITVQIKTVVAKYLF